MNNITDDSIPEPPTIRELWDAYHKACKEWRQPIEDLEHERDVELAKFYEYSNSYRKRRRAQIFNELRELRKRPFPTAPQNKDSGISRLRRTLPTGILNRMSALAMVHTGVKNDYEI